MKYTKIFTDFCHETGQQMRIRIHVEKINLGVTPSSKAMGFDCSHRSEYGCGTCGPDGSKCPVYLKAKAEIER